MKFVVDKEPFNQALQSLSSVVLKKTTQEILSHFFCEAKGSQISLFATDNEVGMKIILPATVTEEGKIALSAKQICDIVKELPLKPIAVSQKSNNWVEISCQKSKFNVVSSSADQYPTSVLHAFEEKEFHQAKSEPLLEMIDRTQFAVATDAAKYHLNGVYFEMIDQGLMRMTATDGHRLSYIDREVFMQNPEIKKGIIIPKKGLIEMRRLLEKDQIIGMAFERNFIFLKMKDTFLAVRLIDSEYPDYKMVIPKSTEKQCKVDRETLISALRRVSLLANEKSKGIKLSIQSNLITITASNPEAGDAQEEIDVQYEQEPIEIGFNAKYLLDCLPVLNSPDVSISLKDRGSPAIFQGTQDLHHNYVVMPMRV